MGVLNDIIKEQQAKTEAESAIVVERLALLKKTAETKIATFKSSMETKFYEEQAKEEPYSIQGRPVSFSAQYRVNAESGIKPQIEQAIDDLFAFDKKKVVNALKFLVMGALKEIIGSTTVGEESTEQFFIIPYNNVVVRLDLRVWKYTFSSGGIMGVVENAFCFIVSKSILSFKKLTPEELIFFVTEALSGAPIDVVADYIEELQAVLDRIGKKNMLMGSAPMDSELIDLSGLACRANSNWESI